MPKRDDDSSDEYGSSDEEDLLEDVMKVPEKRKLQPPETRSKANSQKELPSKANIKKPIAKENPKGPTTNASTNSSSSKYDSSEDESDSEDSTDDSDEPRSPRIAAKLVDKFPKYNPAKKPFRKSSSAKTPISKPTQRPMPRTTSPKKRFPEPASPKKPIPKVTSANEAIPKPASSKKNIPKPTPPNEPISEPTSAEKSNANSTSSEKSMSRPAPKVRGPLRYTDIVEPGTGTKKGGPTLLFLPRRTLEVLSQEPGFDDLVKGFFIRMKQNGRYTLAQILGAKKGKSYRLGKSDLRTNFHLRMQLGKEPRHYSINYVSGSQPVSNKEFDLYKARTLDSGQKLPSRHQVEELLQRARNLSERMTAEEPVLSSSVLGGYEGSDPYHINWVMMCNDAKWELRFRKTELYWASKDDRNLNLIPMLEERVFLAETRLDEMKKMRNKFGPKPVEETMKILEDARIILREKQAIEDMIWEKAREIQGRNELNAFTRFQPTGEPYAMIPDMRGKGKRKTAKKSEE